MQRKTAVAVALVSVLVSVTVVRAANWFKNGWQNFCSATMRNNVWPEAFIPTDRMAARAPFGGCVAAGGALRVRPTGGGGWGDLLGRSYDEVERDLRWGKVSFDGARTGYGVVAGSNKESVVIDAVASDVLRASMRSQRPAQEPFFDRGPGYAQLSGGATSAAVDWL